jgi:hypothetical protein
MELFYTYTQWMKCQNSDYQINDNILSKYNNSILIVNIVLHLLTDEKEVHFIHDYQNCYKILPH